MLPGQEYIASRSYIESIMQEFGKQSEKLAKQRVHQGEKPMETKTQGQDSKKEGGKSKKKGPKGGKKGKKGQKDEESKQEEA